MALVSGYCKFLLIPLPLIENSSSGQTGADTLWSGFSATCPGLILECLGPWEHEPVEKELADLRHSKENACGKVRRTLLLSYRSTIRRDPK